VAVIKLQIAILIKMSLVRFVLLSSHVEMSACLTLPYRYGNIGGLRCGVEQWQLVGLITRRSQVQVLPPLLVSTEDRQAIRFR
jgi:hypothetical protein